MTDNELDALKQRVDSTFADFETNLANTLHELDELKEQNQQYGREMAAYFDEAVQTEATYAAQDEAAANAPVPEPAAEDYDGEFDPRTYRSL